MVRLLLPSVTRHIDMLVVRGGGRGKHGVKNFLSFLYSVFFLSGQPSLPILIDCFDKVCEPETGDTFVEKMRRHH